MSVNCAMVCTVRHDDSSPVHVTETHFASSCRGTSASASFKRFFFNGSMMTWPTSWLRLELSTAFPPTYDKRSLFTVARNAFSATMRSSRKFGLSCLSFVVRRGKAGVRRRRSGLVQGFTKGRYTFTLENCKKINTGC